MSTNIPRKPVIARIGEGVFFFALIPSIIFFTLCHMDEGSMYLLVHGQKLALAATVEDFLRQFPEGDVSYQLKFAVDYARDGTIAEWVINLWPPGLPGLYWLILKLSGSAYFPLKVITLATLLFALASYLLYRSFARGRFSPTALIVCTLPMIYASFKGPIILGTGMFSSDFYCFALLAILLSMMFGEARQSIKHLALMAIVLAALAYFRSFYFIFIKLLTAGSIFALFVWGGRMMVSSGWKTTVKCAIQKNKPIASLGMVLLLTWMLLLPWMVILKIEGRTYDWTATDLAWAATWRKELPSFLVGLNTPCIIEQNLCDQLTPFQYPDDAWATPKLGSDFYKHLSIVTFVSSPLKWYGEKVKIFHYFWFDGYKFDRKMPTSQLIQYILSVVLLAACLSLTLLAAARLVRNVSLRRPLLDDNGLYLLYLSFFVTNLMVFTFVHYEPRYSIPLKWVTYLFFMFLLKDVMYRIDLRIYSNNANRST